MSVLKSITYNKLVRDRIPEIIEKSGNRCVTEILSLYRLTLGQARQEELLEYIFNNCENTEDMKELFINLSPYYKDLKK